MALLPPEKNPLNYPRDPSRSRWRDALILVATLAALGAMFLFAYLLVVPGFRHWGFGYVVGALTGAALMMVYVRVMHGHWP